MADNQKPEYYKSLTNAPRIQNTGAGAFGVSITRVITTIDETLEANTSPYTFEIKHGLKKPYEYIGRYKKTSDPVAKWYPMVTSNSNTFNVLYVNRDITVDAQKIYLTVNESGRYRIQVLFTELTV